MVYISDVIDGILKLTYNWNSSSINKSLTFVDQNSIQELIVEFYNKFIFPLKYEISIPPDNFYKARPELTILIQRIQNFF